MHTDAHHTGSPPLQGQQGWRKLESAPPPSLRYHPQTPLSYRDLRGPSQLFAGHPRISLPPWEIRPDSYRYNFPKAIFYTVLSKTQSYLLSLRRTPVNFLLSLYTAGYSSLLPPPPLSPNATLGSV